MKDYVFKLEKYSDATFFQDSMASIAGAVASISVAQPLVRKEGERKQGGRRGRSGRRSILWVGEKEYSLRGWYGGERFQDLVAPVWAFSAPRNVC